MIIGWRRAVAMLALVASPAAAQSDPAALAEGAALEAATAAACGKRVTMLGEAEHGDARTELFKTALSRNLVTRCGYSAVVFEASFYEFVALGRQDSAGRPLTPALIGTATGGLWKFDREFQPMLHYLAEQAQAGRLKLGGVDFQQGGVGQDYTNFGVVEELTAPLAPGRQAPCRQTFRDHLFKGYAAERAAAIEACLADIGKARLPADPALRRETRALRTNFGAFVRANPADTNAFVARRDAMMAANLDYWLARWPTGTKVIVWTANAHATRSRHGSTGFARAEPFGLGLSNRFAGKLFSLGFTAGSGTMRGRGEARPRQPAAPGSLEADALAGSPRVAFLDQAQLGRLGSRPGAFFSHNWRTENWAELFDAAIVFDTERAAGDLRRDK